MEIVNIEAKTFQEMLDALFNLEKEINLLRNQHPNCQLNEWLDKQSWDIHAIPLDKQKLDELKKQKPDEDKKKKGREEAEKTLLMVNSLKEKVYEEGIEQQKRNNLLISDNQELEDIITDKREQLADLQASLDRVNAAFGRVDEELARAKEELAEVRKLRNELIVQ